MLSKATLWCELMNSILGPWWNLLQKTCSLSILKHWHSIPPHTVFLPNQPQFPLLALHIVDFSPSCPIAFDSISQPDSLSNLSLLFLFSLTQCVCTASPTSSTHLLISAFPSLHELMANFSAQVISSHLSLSSRYLITPRHKSEAQETGSFPQKLFWMPECEVGGITQFIPWQLVHTAVKQKARATSRKNFNSLFLEKQQVNVFQGGCTHTICLQLGLVTS